jgi:hypothetical protein
MQCNQDLLSVSVWNTHRAGRQGNLDFGPRRWLVTENPGANVALFCIGMAYGSKPPYAFVSVADVPY